MEKRTFLLAALLTLTSCLQAGDVSNSTAPKDKKTNMVQYASGKILYSLCGKQAACNTSLDTEFCADKFLLLKNIDTELGVSQGLYTNFEALMMGEIAGKLKVDKNATDMCMNAIDELDCGNQLVKRAYDRNLDNPFARMADMIPQDQLSCQGIFKIK